MTERFTLALFDPPWEYEEPDAVRKFPGTRKAPATAHYQTMTVAAMVEQFRPLVDSLLADDCAVPIWCTGPKTLTDLPQLGFGLGLQPVTKLLCWIKMPKSWGPGQLRMREPDLDFEAFCGLGFYSRSATEDCWLWVKGKPELPDDRTVRQSIHAPEAVSPDALHAARREHSRKPDESYRRIERLWPKARRVEFFARQTRPGWDALGNETTKFDATREVDPLA